MLWSHCIETSLSLWPTPTKSSSSASWSLSPKVSALSSAKGKFWRLWIALSRILLFSELTGIKMAELRAWRSWSSSATTVLKKQRKLTLTTSSSTSIQMVMRSWITRIWCRWSCRATISIWELQSLKGTYLRCPSMITLIQRLNQSSRGYLRSKYLNARGSSLFTTN